MNALMPRRTLLGAVPSLALPMALLPAAIVEVAADPLPGLLVTRAQRHREWLAASALHGEGSSEDKAAWDAYLAAENAIETTVASTAGGVLAQLDYIKVSYCSGLHEYDGKDRLLSDEIPIAFLDLIAEGLRRIGQ